MQHRKRIDADYADCTEKEETQISQIYTNYNCAFGVTQISRITQILFPPSAEADYTDVKEFDMDFENVGGRDEGN